MNIEQQSCNCPVCMSTIWDRRTEDHVPVRRAPTHQPNRIKPSGWFWLSYALLCALSALYFVLR